MDYFEEEIGAQTSHPPNFKHFCPKIKSRENASSHNRDNILFLPPSCVPSCVILILVSAQEGYFLQSHAFPLPAALLMSPTPFRIIVG